MFEAINYSLLETSYFNKFGLLHYGAHTVLSYFVGPCTWDCYLYRNQLACCSLILKGELNNRPPRHASFNFFKNAFSLFMLWRTFFSVLADATIMLFSTCLAFSGAYFTSKTQPYDYFKTFNCSTELLEEMRLKCRALESEVERRQLEAQDGWSTAAQLQQYFRNLHNVLRGSTEQEDDCVGEPSELAELVRNSVASLKNEYQELRDANSKNKEIISMLTRKLTSA